MAPSVIILAGAEDSGKSNTLKRVVRDKLHRKWVRGKVIYPFEGKCICIYTSSPQEQKGVGFCKFKKVNRVIRSRVNKCKSNNCTLLIMQFTLATNRKHELNTNCITKPMERLKLMKVKKAHLVYLQKHCASIDLMDKLMAKLRAQRVIKSSKNTVSRQANELWKFVMQAAP